MKSCAGAGPKRGAESGALGARNPTTAGTLRVAGDDVADSSRAAGGRDLDELIALRPAGI